MPRSHSFSLLAPALLAALVLVPASARAQMPPGGSGHHAPRSAPAPPPPPEPGEEPVPEGEIRIKAESLEQPEKGHSQARGTVDLRFGNTRLLADKADVYEDTQPDGSVKRRLVADGNVVFLRGDERLAGDHMELDDSGRGFLTHAIGYISPGVFVEGRRLERLDDRTYRVEGGRFTSCSQPNPRWKFSAKTAKIQVDDKIIANDAVFRIKGVPAFYTPWIYYPIAKNGRSTGLLFPHFSHSSYKGFGLGTGFFWAMGRSVDQTFYTDLYSKLGIGFGHELRYAETSPSRGTFRTYLFRLKGGEPVLDPGTGETTPGSPAVTDYDIDWNALQILPGNIKTSLNVRKYSDLLFRQRFQDNFNLASSRTQRWSLSVERDLRLAVLSAYADTTNTYFGETYQHVSGRTPGLSLRRFPRQVGWAGLVFGLDATADRVKYGNQDRVDTWSRVDFAPVLSRPFNVSFLDFNPALAYRHTRYGSTNGVAPVLDENGNPVLDENGNPKEQAAIVGPPMNRNYFETSLEIRGPTFSKVFDTPGNFYSERLKHTIGPEITWRYRTRVDNANLIPKFDGIDYMYGTDEIQYALVQRFFSKRVGPSGKAMPYEFFSWRMQQTYYVQINQSQNNFDPNYSSSAFGPGFKPEHLSPLASRMRFRPEPQYAIDYNLEYDVNFQQLTRMSAAAQISTGRVSFNGGWSRSLRLSEDPAQRTVGSHTIRASTLVDLLPQRMALEGALDYDLVHDILYNLRGQLHYRVQCCGFSVEYIRYNWNSVVDARWRFNVELAGVGAMGNFLGADTPGSRQGLGGYR